MSQHGMRGSSYLIFVNLRLLQLWLSLFLEGDDNQGHENVDEEEWKDDEVNNVENGHFHSEQRDGGLVLKGGGHGLLENTGKQRN